MTNKVKVPKQYGEGFRDISDLTIKELMNECDVNGIPYKKKSSKSEMVKILANSVLAK